MTSMPSTFFRATPYSGDPLVVMAGARNAFRLAKFEQAIDREYRRSIQHGPRYLHMRGWAMNRSSGFASLVAAESFIRN